MLRLIALTCLFAAVAAQRFYYCNGTVTIRENEFSLFTRRITDMTYPPGLTCEFNAESAAGAFFVEIQSFRVSTAVLTISSGGRTLFRGSSLQNYQSSITTPTKSLQVRFDASGDYSSSAGVTMRVRALDLNGCPFGWTFLKGNCFGTSTTSGRLNFTNAQRACNSMRSNLLQLPSSYHGNIGAFVRLLPSSLRSLFMWVGLTDRSRDGQFRHYWLNGYRQSSTSQISCMSSGSYLSCYSYERCGTMYGGSDVYSIFMANCNSQYQFACSMPPGGTDFFYSVPDGISIATYTTSSAWVYGVAVACAFVVGLVIAGVYGGMRSRARRTVGATSVVVSAGRVTVPPPTGSYPAQQYPGQHPGRYPGQYPGQYPRQYPGQHPVPPAPQYSADPPTYDEAVGAGSANAGYMK